MKIKNIFVILLIVVIVQLSGCQNIPDEITGSEITSEQSENVPNSTTNSVNEEESMQVDKGGISLIEYSSDYNTHYNEVPTFVINDEDVTDKWVHQFKAFGGERENSEFDIITLVTEMNISKDIFIEQNKGQYSDDEIEAIYSGNQAVINRVFVNPCALLIDDKIYSASWMANHSYGDYKKAGMTDEMLIDYLKLIKASPLEEEYRQIYKNVTGVEIETSAKKN